MLVYITAILPRVVYNPLMFDILPVKVVIIVYIIYNIPRLLCVYQSYTYIFFMLLSNVIHRKQYIVYILHYSVTGHVINTIVLSKNS